MDAVILAGGRGTRVSALIPEFHKPLLPINGIPLIRHLVNLAHDVGVSRPIVVVAPENESVIHNALNGRDVLTVIQDQPLGPGHALLRGLTRQPGVTFNSERVLVMLSDNIISTGDVLRIKQEITAVGVRWIPRSEAARFTRLDSDGVWREKVPLQPSDVAATIPCWVGPFIGWRSHMLDVLTTECENARELGTEALIGPHLRSFMHDGEDHIISVSSLDIGTLDAYQRFTQEDVA
jgi:molybdopterin-guanine dinucleotide biosynthesis protein A